MNEEVRWWSKWSGRRNTKKIQVEWSTKEIPMMSKSEMDGWDQLEMDDGDYFWSKGITQSSRSVSKKVNHWWRSDQQQTVEINWKWMTDIPSCQKGSCRIPDDVEAMKFQWMTKIEAKDKWLRLHHWNTRVRKLVEPVEWQGRWSSIQRMTRIRQRSTIMITL